jgi:hypothetical protein
MRRRESVTVAPHPALQALAEENPALGIVLRDIYDHLFIESEGGGEAGEPGPAGPAGAPGADGADGAVFVDRGDPAAADFDEGDLTINGSWHDLDLSAIIDAGATLVLLRVAIITGAADKLQFRENGNSNAVNVATVGAHPAGYTGTFYADVLVAPDASGIIEYRVALGWSGPIDITVGGWWV